MTIHAEQLVDRIYRTPLVPSRHTAQSDVRDQRAVATVIVCDENPERRDILKFTKLRSVLNGAISIILDEVKALHCLPVLCIAKVECLVVDEKFGGARGHPISAANEREGAQFHRAYEGHANNQLWITILTFQSVITFESSMVCLENILCGVAGGVECRDAAAVDVRQKVV